MANFLIYTLLFFFTLFMLFKLYNLTRPTVKKNPPPSPPKLPIIGNLHQIGPLFHRSLYALSERYGKDLMLLHFGLVPSLVVSSADAAREIMQTHDLKFASRAAMYLNKCLLYDFKGIGTAPYGEYWREARKTLVLYFLSNNKVQSFSGLRDQEILKTINSIEKSMECNKVVNLADLFLEHTTSVICMATFGKSYDNDEIGKRFKKVANDFFEAFSHFYFVDYIPQLAWIDRIRGSHRRVESVAKDIDDLLEEVVRSRVAEINSGKAYHDLGEGLEPFLDSMLKIQKDGYSFHKDGIKALLMDTYFASIETTASMLEWVMAELLKHPDALKKAQEEVRKVIDGKKLISDEDVDQMHYLKAVIMEATRLHPPALPFTRVSMQDANVMGFDIAKGTRVYINTWAIARDPKEWDKPNEFVPERFLGSSMDFVMYEFKLLPFGAGRRSCPGKGYAVAVVEKMLANLLCKFDWTLPNGLKPKDLDMDETVGLAIYKKTPLLALATPFSW